MSDDIIQRYRRLYSGVIYDALYYDLGYRDRFVINRGIYHLAGNVPMVGPAFTCKGRRPTVHAASHEEFSIRDEKRLGIFVAMERGQVVVMDTDGDDTVAHFGDITAQIFERAGVAGVVIDGYTRDIGRISLPLFARGVQPQDAYGKWALESWGAAVEFRTTGNSRIFVYPDDIIFGDRDGVMVIPGHMGKKTLEAAEKRLERENYIRIRIDEGVPLRQIYKETGRW